VERELPGILCLDLSFDHCGKGATWLGEGAWQVYHVVHQQEAFEIVNTHSIQVGLAIIDSLEIDTEPLSKLFCQDPTVFWVALITANCLENKVLQTLLATQFYDYQLMPLNEDHFRITVNQAARMSVLRKKIRQAGLSEALERSSNPGFPDPDSENETEMVGASPPMLALFNNIRRVASVDAPVLITGESGTGKELTARAIHERSPRRAGPFHAVNCGALSTNLIQSELFGHEKGAFTGAHQRKLGRFEAAAGGTLFLDEIGDLPLETQVNLLRVLQEKTIERVGSHQSISIDVRIIAATHVNLEQAVKEGRFREDLYYRINVINLTMPALRERGEDVVLLARYFFRQFSRERAAAVQGFSEAALRALLQYTWPGNIRELINRVRRALVLCESRLISAADLGLQGRNPVWETAASMTLDQAREKAEKEAIRAALCRSRNNISQAAAELGISRMTLYRMLEKYHSDRLHMQAAND
jgi:DNA-binding NtrC family response regulator